MANRNSKKWLWTLVVLGIMIAIGVIVFHPSKPKLGPPTVGYDTTRLTGPLRADGTVDYIAALNQMYSKGVTPDNNAAVLLLRAIGPDAIDAQIRDEVYRRLGMAPLPAEGNYFVSLDDFAKEHTSRLIPATQPQTDPNDDAEVFRGFKGSAPTTTPTPICSMPVGSTAWYVAHEQLDETLSRPWSADEFPVLADWLMANEIPLAMAVEASKREKYYRPMVVPPGKLPVLMETFTQGLGTYRGIAKALACRATLKADQGDVQAAWQDLLAIQLLAKRVSDNTLIGLLVAMSMESKAHSAMEGLFGHCIVDDATARTILRDLEALAPLPAIADIIDGHERLFTLEFFTLCSMRGTKFALGIYSAIDCPDIRADWDEVLRESNRQFDRVVAILRLPTFPDRNRELERLEDELMEFLNPESWFRDTTWDCIEWLADKVGTTWQREDVFITAMRKEPAKAILATIPAIYGRAGNLRDVAEMTNSLLRLAATLAAFKAERGEYPADLAELSPDYLKTIPNDLFIEKPLHYSRTAGGYVLYSVGPDMTDDGGDEYEDDIVVQVPLPARSAE